MSAIAGILCLARPRADASVVERMTMALRHRGPDRGGLWSDGPIAMGHRMLETTPESLGETQPLTSADGHLCLTLDGRVDNRRELTRALAAAGVGIRDGSDAELVLQSYVAWGVECPTLILGDFAFAVWDKPRQRLFCARDPLGMKPLCYQSDARAFRWASELHALFEDPEVPRTPNEGMVAETLACEVTSKEETLWRGIRRLPPGHAMVIDAGGLRIVRYWQPDAAREIRYRSDEEYALHFLEILTEAVRCRLRSHRPVGAHLSGGMDSSSVVAVAQRVFRDGLASDLGFETFSLVYPGLRCDESAYIRAVAGDLGLKANLVEPTRRDHSYWIGQSRRYRDLTDFPNGGAGAGDLYAVARERGVRVMLTGIGGNQWIEGTTLHMADLLAGGRLGALVTQARAAMALIGYPSLASVLWGAAFLPLVPAGLRGPVGRLLGRRRPPPWIEAGFARATGLAERLRAGEPDPPFPTRAQRTIYREGTSGVEAHANELTERSAAEHGLEERHPLHDLRLVEFMLAVPEEQRWLGAETKRVLRHAMRDMLPETVRRREIQADFSDLFALALEGLGGERFFDDLAVADLGWVSAPEARVMWRRMAARRREGDLTYIRDAWPLWVIVAMELWYRGNVSPADGEPARVHGG
jgi:asparagine synthase (glutamine-hydrolysing)